MDAIQRSEAIDLELSGTLISVDLFWTSRIALLPSPALLAPFAPSVPNLDSLLVLIRCLYVQNEAAVNQGP